MIPVRGHYGCHKICDPRPILCNGHTHFPSNPRIPVSTHAGVTFMRTVPEFDPGSGKQIRYRHHRRTDDAEGMFNAMHLQDFHKCFFGGHLHIYLQVADN